MIQVAPGTITFENMGKVKVDGLEVDGRYFFKRGGYVGAYYTLNDSRLDTGGKSPNVPDRTAGCELNLPFGEKVNWNVNAYWQSETERVAGDRRKNVDEYAIVNSTVLIRDVWKNLELQFSIFNLFDEDYAYPAPVNTYRNDYPAPGRSFVLGASWHF